MATIAKTEQDWQAESDASTLIQAQEIKQDKKRLKRAMVHLRKRKKAINAVS